MKSNPKIQAFTMGELLVVMVISSIVVTLSFLALSTIQRQMRSINTAFEKSHQITQLERRLLADLQGSDVSFSTNSKMTFVQNNDTITYTSLENKMVRDKDTLTIAANNIIFYLEGEKVTSGNFDAMELSFGDTYGDQGFFIFKRNDASHYINN